MAAPKKALKIRRALKTAARFPARVSGGRGSGRNRMSPAAGELPLVLLRVQIVRCAELAAKDKNGTSDPFVAVSLARNRFQTPVSKRTLNPVYAQKDATFDFPIYLSLADKLGVLELVVWDKDLLKKDYLGEAALSLESWFKDPNAAGFDDINNMPFSVDVVSSRASTHATGTIEVKLGFVKPQQVNHSMTFEEIYNELVRRSRHADISLLSAPPTEGIGTIRSHSLEDHNNGHPIPTFEDDGLSSDEGEPNWEEDDDEREYPPSPAPELADDQDHAEAEPEHDSEPHPEPEPEELTPIASPPLVEASPSASPAAKPQKGGKFPKVFRRPQGSRQASTESTLAPSISSKDGKPTRPGLPHGKSKRFKKSWGNKKKAYNFTTANDILGVVVLEIQGAEDLPRLKNLTRTGWDMDPFVVISFGKKVFRTRVVRHSRNPVWDEKVLFHVRRYESEFKVQLTVLDWDKLSSNDHVGDAYFDLSELTQNAPQKDPKTGLYPEDTTGASDMREMKVNLSTAKEMPWEARHNPVLTVRAKYQPYDALRQRFWRQYLKQYDTDDTGMLSRLELTSMLDSLGSTLSRETVDGFFTRHGKQPKQSELTVDEAIQCLEAEVCRPASEKKRLEEDHEIGLDTSIPSTPMFLANWNDNEISGGENGGKLLGLENLDFSGAPVHPSAVLNSQQHELEMSPPPAAYPTEPAQQKLSDIAQPFIHSASTRVPMSFQPSVDVPRIEAPEPTRQASTSSSEGYDSGTNSDDSFERVINIKNCPLCHRPRLNSKAEMDIVTHLAVCASQDPSRVDRIVVGNFVTASQAQRKWYTKVISKVSSGNYKLGANSANIIVQNRITGQLEEEKMQVYVRLGIRLLYKGAKSRMEGARARRLLKSLSIKQGMKYDSPESAREIPAFVEFHKLNVEELADPLESFKTFNQFFYRKLKSDARPVKDPEDHSRLVSCADCRMMAFETVSEATQIWIKGREFSVARLLGPAYKDQADKYVGGALAVFRLAPQDYHRFHSPVDGVIGPMTYIAGEYYTVNPQAIRTSLDVYGENARKIVPIDSPCFGRVMAVCVGAMMVGSIKTTVNEGDEIKRGQEFGYFAFGGSTIVLLFEKATVEWDEDLLINGRASLETLVRVGMGVGRSIKGRRVAPKSKSSLSASPSPGSGAHLKLPST